MRKIFLEELPRYNNNIDWSNSIGYSCKFVYDTIEGEIKIVDYNKKENKLTIKYLNYEPYKIPIGSFKSCKIHNYIKCYVTGISYPEKFIMSLLDQLKVNYIKEYSPEWIKPKRYDFYFELDNKKYIIETHGRQHYTNSGFPILPQEQQTIDKHKRILALKNGINYYIELDCRKSDMIWITNSILNSELNKIFGLSQIDWSKCEEFALNDIVKEVCNYWRIHNEINNEGVTTTELGKIFNLSYRTISRYLKYGNRIGICHYSPNEEMSKTRKRKVAIIKDNKILGVFESCSELSRKSKELFGIELKHNRIADVCRGVIKQYKGFMFEYV